jgi:predicted transposase YbfD/YdcC
MEDPAAGGPLRFFADVPDPRAANVRHRLPDMLLIALCAVICGADGWDDFEEFAEAKESWFKSFMDLQHGVPSADTFRRVISSLDPAAFEACFMKWMHSVVDLSAGKLLAIDGKSIRRSFDHAWDKSGMAHMVSLFVAENGQVFSQLQAQGKGGELETITQLLGLVELRGAVVTIDALGCQKHIAQAIVDRGGEYVLCVKDNQPTLHATLATELDEMILQNFEGVRHGHHESVDAGHGRIETRRVWVTADLDWLKAKDQWPQFKSIAVVEARREVPGHQDSLERRYYISSLGGHDARAMAGLIRGHWSIENSLHHVLDVSFREDDSRIHKNHGAENVSRLRRWALNLLKDHGSRYKKRRSIKGRRKSAAWDHDFLLKIITG